MDVEVEGSRRRAAEVRRGEEDAEGEMGVDGNGNEDEEEAWG